ncbi:MAG TPA: alpha/beta hydrolase [Candidatus Obscuribacterales bacterium]
MRKALVMAAAVMFFLVNAIQSGLARGAEFDVYRDLPYVTGAPASQRLDLYVPNNANGPFPVVVWIHGGGWIAGDKYAAPFDDVLKRGWAAVSINHRPATAAPFPAQVHDCKAAVRFLRAHARDYNLDANRIAVWGESSGGHLAALLATTGNVKELEGTLGNPGFSSAVQAVVDWCGPADLTTISSQAKLPAQKFLSSPQGQIAVLLGGMADKRRDLAAMASPATFASADDPPMLIVHGTNDEVVPVQQSIDFFHRLRNAGAPVRLQVISNATHNLGSAFTRKQALDFIAECFSHPGTAPAATSSHDPPFDESVLSGSRASEDVNKMRRIFNEVNLFGAADAISQPGTAANNAPQAAVSQTSSERALRLLHMIDNPNSIDRAQIPYFKEGQKLFKKSGQFLQWLDKQLGDETAPQGINGQ